jgi:hypothetical protein
MEGVPKKPEKMQEEMDYKTHVVCPSFLFHIHTWGKPWHWWEAIVKMDLMI